MTLRGRATFDYSKPNGIYAIGRGDALFETMWKEAGGDSIHNYKAPPPIDATASATYANNITEIKDTCATMRAE